MLDLIMKRRSIRKYTSEKVSDKEIGDILKAAMAAPSASNLRPCEFIVVKDETTKQRLAGVHPYAKMCAGASCIIVIIGDKSNPKWIEDGSAATENILLMVTSLNLGAVWVDVRGCKYGGTDDETSVRNVLGIPNSYGVLCMIPIGHPAEQKPPRTQYNPDKIHYDKFGQKKG